ncbi:MAG: YoaK family protein [Steroidobacterales bacterium]
MKLSLPVLLSVNGGYVDSAGFLALQGLFSSHVTGNFVTLGASLVLGTTGVVAKLMALPLFCLVVALVRVLGYSLGPHAPSQLRALLSVMFVLLLSAAALAVRLGPFPNGDVWPALLTGMTLVSAMAVQNAVQRLYLGAMPPTTIMTGNTTQAMIDAVDLLRGLPPADPARRRLANLAANILAFAIGCATAALLFVYLQMWCFVVPPLLGLVAITRARDSASG